MKKQIKIVLNDKPLNISYIFREAGDRSILFIHGLGSAADCFEDVWDFSDFLDFTIMAFDLPGFGDSDKPEWLDYSMQSQAEICSLIVRKFNLNHINLVAHSMGGAIGLLAIPAISSLMDSFICLEGNLIGADCSGSRAALNYTFNDFRRGGFHKLRSEIGSKADANYARCLAKCPDFVFYRSSESLVEWSDSGKLLENFLNLDINKSYVYGEHNENSPVLSYLPGINKLKIPRAGHGMMADNPQAFYSGLLGLLG